MDCGRKALPARLTPAPASATLGGMRNPSSKPRRPTDINQLARAIVEAAADQAEPGADQAPVDAAEVSDLTPGKAHPPEPDKDPAAVALGRRGGLKGGKARAAGMTAEERSEAARKAARARWEGRE